MPEKTIFKKIIDKEIPANVLYEDDLCIAFPDISPQAPVHILIIPKEEIISLAYAEEKHKELLGHLLLVTSKLAEEHGVKDGFRTVMNSGAKAGQSVFHLHIHLLGDREMKWPPG
ncbi:histidine triad nucleotide-binding protein [Lacunimicrobium album]